MGRRTAPSLHYLAPVAIDLPAQLVALPLMTPRGLAQLTGLEEQDFFLGLDFKNAHRAKLTIYQTRGCLSLKGQIFWISIGDHSIRQDGFGSL